MAPLEVLLTMSQIDFVGNVGNKFKKGRIMCYRSATVDCSENTWCLHYPQFNWVKGFILLFPHMHQNL